MVIFIWLHYKHVVFVLLLSLVRILVCAIFGKFTAVRDALTDQLKFGLSLIDMFAFDHFVICVSHDSNDNVQHHDLGQKCLANEKSIAHRSLCPLLKVICIEMAKKCEVLPDDHVKKPSRNAVVADLNLVTIVFVVQDYHRDTKDGESHQHQKHKWTCVTQCLLNQLNIERRLFE